MHFLKELRSNVLQLTFDPGVPLPVSMTAPVLSAAVCALGRHSVLCNVHV